MIEFIPFALFAIAASITPGPTNLIVLSQSVRYGIVATLPVVLGGCVGAALVVLAAGLGIGDALTTHVTVRLWLQGAGIAWLTYLAWQLWRSPVNATLETKDDRARLGFLGAAALQLINPKAWMMALAVVAVFSHSDGSHVQELALLTGIFFVASLPCLTCWAMLGSAANRWLDTPARRSAFNRTLAFLLLLSAWSTLIR
ncbi:LysE family translocator [Pseudomonas sp. Marseille-QA0892]